MMTSPQQIARRIAAAVGMLLLALLIMQVVLAGWTSRSLGNTFNAIAPSLALDSQGQPVISLSVSVTNFPRVYLVHCRDANCDHIHGGDGIWPVDTYGYSLETSVEVDSLDYPVVSYSLSGVEDLRVTHCADPD